MGITTTTRGSGARHARTWAPTVFTLERARRALPYVARVVRDAAQAYRHVQQCRNELMDANTSAARNDLSAKRDAALHQLNAATDECNAVGADLVDLDEGVVCFPAELDARRVTLVWRLGEPVTNAWPDI